MTELKKENEIANENSDENVSNNNLCDTNETEEFLKTIEERKGKRPDISYGKYHKLMEMAWLKGNIEKIYESKDNELLYIFYLKCVSVVSGKRKWNKYSQSKKLRTFVTPSDEAFAMVCIENNLPKWMEEVRTGKMKPNEKKRSLYTEEDNQKCWSIKGLLRYMQLCKICTNMRNGENQNEQIWNNIENVVMRKEQDWNESSKRKRKRYDDEEENQMNNGIDENDEELLKQYMLDMVNGGSTINE